MTETPPSPETKAKRASLIAKAALRRKRSDAMLAQWERRRAEQREFMEDDGSSESVGSPDGELMDLPDGM